MPFITPQVVIPLEELRAKIEQPVVEDVKLYAAFLNSSQAYVVQELLREGMAKDREFQASLNPEENPEPRKRGKKRSIAVVA